MPFETLEAAQAEILRLQQENTELTNERDTLSQNNETLSADLERVRTLNQQYFNRLTAQFAPDPRESDKEETAPTCEDYARTLNI